MKNAKPETEVRLYVGDEENLFYVTDAGVVYTLTMTQLADAYEQEQPFPVAWVSGLPLNRYPFTLEKDCPNSRAVREWLDAMDLHMSNLANELAEHMARAPKPPTVPPVPSSPVPSSPVASSSSPMVSSPMTEVEPEPEATAPLAA